MIRVGDLCEVLEDRPCGANLRVGERVKVVVKMLSDSFGVLYEGESGPPWYVRSRQIRLIKKGSRQLLLFNEGE